MKTLASISAILIVLAVCASSASAATSDALTISQTATAFQFRYTDPNWGSGVIVDFDGDGKGDAFIATYPTVSGTQYVRFSYTFRSTTGCQDEGNGASSADDITGTTDPGNVVTLNVPKQRLPVNFSAKAVSYAGPDEQFMPGEGGFCVMTTLQGEVPFQSGDPVITPDAPAGLTAYPYDGQVDLYWTAVAGADSYKIYRDGQFLQYSRGNFADEQLTAVNGESHDYTVTAVERWVESAQSNSVTATPTAPPVVVPDAPTNLAAVAGNGQVTLTWNAVPGADHYKIYLNGQRIADGQGEAPGDATSTFVYVPNDTPSRFEITAFVGGVESALSNSVTATATAPAVITPPDTPTGLAAVGGANSVTLSWNPVADASGYSIFVDGQPAVWVDGNTTTTQIYAHPNQPTSYQVAAVARGEQSALSDSVSATATDSPQQPDPAAQAVLLDPQEPSDAPASVGSPSSTAVAPGTAAPAKPKLKRLTATTITLALPAAPRGAKLALSIRVAGRKFAAVKAKPGKHGELTIKNLKRNTHYELKLVAVRNGKPSAPASLKLTTKRK